MPGGFAWLDDRGEPDAGRPLQLWITARMTHVFALGELLGHPGCGALADHGLAALRGAFEDREHGGWYSELARGGPVHTGKEAYPHSFVLLAAASAALAGRAPAGPLLNAAASVVELAGGPGWDLAGLSSGTSLGAAVSGILYYGLGFFFYLAGLRHVPASYAGAFLPLIPVFGVAAGYLVGERLEPRQWLGAIVIVAATVTIAVGHRADQQRVPHE